MRFFGPTKYLKPGERHVQTPVGVQCVFCEEEIKEGDMGTLDMIGQPSHYECSMRSVIGSVAHQLHQCSCFGGAGEDPPGMSRREAAIAAARSHEAGMQNIDTYKITTDDAGRSITCLRCDSVSYNPNDINNLYCGRCYAPHLKLPLRS